MSALRPLTIAIPVLFFLAGCGGGGTAATSGSRVAILANPQSPTGQAVIDAVSDDGTTAVGTFPNDPGGGTAAIWRRGVAQGIPFPGASGISEFQAVSPSGNCAVGTASAPNLAWFFWSARTGVVPIQGVSGPSSRLPVAVSDQGVVTGNNGANNEAYSWSPSGGLVNIGVADPVGLNPKVPPGASSYMVMHTDWLGNYAYGQAVMTYNGQPTKPSGSFGIPRGTRP